MFSFVSIQSKLVIEMSTVNDEISIIANYSSQRVV